MLPSQSNCRPRPQFQKITHRRQKAHLKKSTFLVLVRSKDHIYLNAMITVADANKIAVRYASKLHVRGR